MRNKKRNSNIKILQSQIQNFAIQEDKNDEPIHTLPNVFPIKDKNIGSGINSKDLPIVDKIKKKGVPKNELINTRRLLTM